MKKIVPKPRFSDNSNTFRYVSFILASPLQRRQRGTNLGGCGIAEYSAHVAPTSGALNGLNEAGFTLTAAAVMD